MLFRHKKRWQYKLPPRKTVLNALYSDSKYPYLLCDCPGQIFIYSAFHAVFSCYWSSMTLFYILLPS